MTGRQIAEKLMQHPDAEVCNYGIRGSIKENNILFNGSNWWIGA